MNWGFFSPTWIQFGQNWQPKTDLIFYNVMIYIIIYDNINFIYFKNIFTNISNFNYIVFCLLCQKMYKNIFSLCYCLIDFWSYFIIEILIQMYKEGHEPTNISSVSTDLKYFGNQFNFEWSPLWDSWNPSNISPWILRRWWNLEL